ncbi:phage-like protein [Yersinia enterocolitica]|uniref:Phage-like protein n=2 Tax=Yersinia enterocolitica TaxID=630 RepID=A0ABM9S8J8_YEREN|nr:phage-like protein [Yersinia enterocolitica]CQD62223.1 phage-like protein [Yersinia enterocolitica]CRX79461.1 phage-like protein [Yersinia enterocolitica]
MGLIMHKEAMVRIDPDYTGRIVLTIENGKIKGEQRLDDSVFIATLAAFLELAKMAGYSLSIATVQELSHG